MCCSYDERQCERCPCRSRISPVGLPIQTASLGLFLVVVMVALDSRALSGDVGFLASNLDNSIRCCAAGHSVSGATMRESSGRRDIFPTNLQYLLSELSPFNPLASHTQLARCLKCGTNL